MTLAAETQLPASFELKSRPSPDSGTLINTVLLIEALRLFQSY
jgi:hypothetical protein